MKKALRKEFVPLAQINWNRFFRGVYVEKLFTGRARPGPFFLKKVPALF